MHHTWNYKVLQVFIVFQSCCRRENESIGDQLVTFTSKHLLEMLTPVIKPLSLRSVTQRTLTNKCTDVSNNHLCRLIDFKIRLRVCLFN